MGSLDASDAQNTAFRNWAGWEAHDDQSTASAQRSPDLAERTKEKTG